MRDLNQAALDALDEDDVIHIIPLADFDFVEGIQRFWAGPEGHAISWGGFTWNALADLGQIDKISEAQQGLADSRTIVSLRVDSETVDVIEGADSRGRAAHIHLLITDDQLSVLGSLTFTKTMGALRVAASVRRGEEQSRVVDERIELELLDETAKLNRSHISRMTYEQGLRIDPNDHGLEFVSDSGIGTLGKGLEDPRTRPRNPPRPQPGGPPGRFI